MIKAIKDWTFVQHSLFFPHDASWIKSFKDYSLAFQKVCRINIFFPGGLNMMSDIIFRLSCPYVMSSSRNDVTKWHTCAKHFLNFFAWCYHYSSITGFSKTWKSWSGLTLTSNICISYAANQWRSYRGGGQGGPWLHPGIEKV